MSLINSTKYNLLEPDIIKGKGTRVISSKGKSYLDFEAGVWCLPLGHCPDELNLVYSEQSKELVHVGYLYDSPIVAKAATRLLNICEMPDGKCVFLSSGSEAVEYAVRVAKKIYPGYLGCRLDGYYLSAYGNAQTEDSSWIQIHDNIDQIDFSRIKYFLFEPGNCSGMVKLPDKSFILKIVNKVLDNHGIIIVDEVTTGLGRTGKWFGYMHYDFKPDIVVVGKGLGNGYPVSAAIFKSNIINQAMEKGFGYAQSHQNDPLGARIVLEVIDLIERKNVLQNSTDLGLYLKSQLNTLKTRYRFIREIRGVGLMNALSFEDDVNEELINWMQQDLYEEGLLVQVKPNLKLMRFYPPLIISKDELDYLILKLSMTFDKIKLDNTKNNTRIYR